MLQPVAFSCPSMSIQGYGSISDLFQLECLEHKFLAAQDKGLGKTLVLFIRMRRTSLTALDSFSALTKAFYNPVINPERPPSSIQGLTASTWERLQQVVKRPPKGVKLAYHQKLLGCGVALHTLLDESRTLALFQSSSSMTEVRDGILKEGIKRIEARGTKLDESTAAVCLTCSFISLAFKAG